ncbi:GNAT family N-acyltransferase [Marinomonas algicola]|uniref:GNAT family N-acyltransferase n=1 Tax=Marinomonas algicola TaxID=2773454 RepID=UPI001EFF2F3C|nr:lysophospholipid acyltransferase family protein [Marinomonas algicola]
MHIEQIIAEKSPNFLQKHPLFTRPTLEILKHLFHEQEVNNFLDQNKDCLGFEFIDRVLNHFNFNYQASQIDRRNIPATGRVIIIANHPLGALDGLALLRLVGEVRNDVKIIANDMLMHFDALKNLILPVDNLSRKSSSKQLKNIIDCLRKEQAVIIFPAGEVSRLSPSGIKDQKWSASYLKLAQKTNSPLLPVYINGRNSLLFYTSSIIYRPLSTIQLAHEMFKQQNRHVPIQIGQQIPIQELAKLPLSNKEKNKLVKRHLYRIAKGKKPLLQTETTISHPQDSKRIKAELSHSEFLGSTKDGKHIYLFDYLDQSSTIKEIGRLREISFRTVGEGTGQSADLDKFDQYYRHLVLWDEEQLEIVGAYRIGEINKYIKSGSTHAIYTEDLFQLSPDMIPYLEQGVELGRSFVQPKYWGKRSLDYLWYGIGAYLNRHPEVRYLFGPVSLSNNYPQLAKDLLVYFYSVHFPDTDSLASSFSPYQISLDNKNYVTSLIKGKAYDEDFKTLKEQLNHLNVSVPTLYKQYSELCDNNGVRFLDFGVDADFGFCIDGLVLVDLSQVKDAKNKRYRGINPLEDSADLT